MNYNDDIKRSITYIEKHIKEELTANEIAEHIGYSVFHFCRVFSLYQGTPLMDYVRKKRLVQAREELLSNRKIIDIAFDYGFKTASGFSKAFRKEFGYSPTVYIARNNSLSSSKNMLKIESYNMNPTFTKKSAFKVAGYGIKTNISNGYTKDIAAYWDTYTGENLESKMYEQLNPPKHGEVGICVSSSDESNVKYLFGVIVDDYSKVTSDMMTIDVPKAEYAVFTTPPVDNVATAATYNTDPLSEVVKATWKYIFEEWFQDSEYVFDETKIDFEFYDERCHGLENAVMDIYVPIKKKS
ncbi:AraC family transcriptional regulator [Lysinibacillus xylanilyticus]|uniref:AraC family transcriptional regulator n=1 Tax=Lysinibacillus xylanilyticus TaxID=582475 RepID=A0ABT4EVQ4_9BACI|nr:AraC family transcriptional regulator [Lysinibacillus xylanilyticus]MCY9549765.1 AraC family transcriptional regulator [Lysinibacillus xylanilyticus]MED3803625.1 AraC family transcriptional regulator [Lysinibacillus xylanilyticus]